MAEVYREPCVQQWQETPCARLYRQIDRTMLPRIDMMGMIGWLKVVSLLFFDSMRLYIYF